MCDVRPERRGPGAGGGHDALLQNFAGEGDEHILPFMAHVQMKLRGAGMFRLKEKAQLRAAAIGVG